MSDHYEDRKTFEDEAHRLLLLDNAVRHYLACISDPFAVASAAKWHREMERLVGWIGKDDE